MNVNAHIPLSDAIRVLQDTHGILVDRGALRRWLRREERRTVPMGGDAIQLIRKITELKSKEPTVEFNFTVNDEECLENVWWTFLGWISEYENYGALLDVCMVAKALENVYSIPLVSMNWRTNSGNHAYVCRGIFPKSESRVFSVVPKSIERNKKTVT